MTERGPHCAADAHLALTGRYNITIITPSAASSSWKPFIQGRSTGGSGGGEAVRNANFCVLASKVAAHVLHVFSGLTPQEVKISA